MRPRPNPQEHQAQIDQAIKQFRAWDKAGVNLLDTETTGLEGKVWQLALVDSTSRAPLLVFHCDPGPDCEWSEVAEKMQRSQGIYPGDFPPAEAFTQVVWKTLQKHALVGWNVYFDIGAVARTWPLAEREQHDLVAKCAMEVYAPLAGQWSESRGEWKYVSLEKACELEDVDTFRLPAPHTAYGDCVRLSRLIRRVADRETSSEQAKRQTAEDVALYGDGSTGPE